MYAYIDIYTYIYMYVSKHIPQTIDIHVCTLQTTDVHVHKYGCIYRYTLANT